MRLAVDVHYAERSVITAVVGFSSWSASTSVVELLVRSDSPPARYEPGGFYRRELPHLLAAVQQVEARHPCDAIIVDGDVWLDAGEPGLGARLYEALGRRAAVIGVAKSAWRWAWTRRSPRRSSGGCTDLIASPPS
jgi:deoxyribonuclease V